MTFRRWVLIVLSAFFVFVGCGGKKDGGGCGITLDPFGGFAMIVVSPGGDATVSGRLVDFVEPDDEASVTIPEKGAGCGGSYDPFVGLPLVPMSAGTAMTFAAVGFSVAATLDSNGVYVGAATGAPTDEEYVIDVGAGTGFPAQELGTVRVPDPVTGSAPPIVPGEDLEVEFTDDTHADVVVISLVSADGLVRYTCFAKADGDYTVKGEVTAELGSGATIVFQAEERNVVKVDGREVMLIGATRSE